MIEITVSKNTLTVSGTGHVIELSKPVAHILSVGIQGPAGPGAAFYTHNQPVASATWVINHNLGYFPQITLFTVGGAEFEGEIVNTSVNQAIVYLATATAGTARCA